MASVNLSALVVTRPASKPKKGIKEITDISVRFGQKVVARLTVAGRLNEAAALREFSLRGKQFKPETGSEEIFKALVK